MDWYFVITEGMRRLGLKGNELVVYAILHGYSQNRAGCYYGGKTLLAGMAGVTARTLDAILLSLEEKGLIDKEPITRTGRALYSYSTRKNCGGPPQKLQGTPAEIAPNNNNYNISFSKEKEREIDARARGFKVPTLEEVKAYCDERRNNIDAAEFIDHYTSNGWKIGKAPMRDWRAAVRTWERKRTATPAAPSTAEIMKERRLKYGKNDFLMQNLEALDQLNGTHYVDDYLHGRPLPTDLPALI